MRNDERRKKTHFVTVGIECVELRMLWPTLMCFVAMLHILAEIRFFGLIC